MGIFPILSSKYYTRAKDIPIPGETILLMEAIGLSPVNFNQIKKWTMEDPMLSHIGRSLLHGVAFGTDECYTPYVCRVGELTIHEGCILWGGRIVIPQKGHGVVLDMLHEGHPGISRMKGLARSYVWWPGIDRELEEKVGNVKSA